MKKNHFILPWFGNKRSEVEKIKKYIDFEKIETIVEPFCGSSAVAYYISTLYPKKYKYILNDNDKYLMELYRLMKNEVEFKKFLIDYGLLLNSIDKEKYVKIVKEKNLMAYFLGHKFFNIRPNLYRNDGVILPNYLHLDETPIIKFLRTEDVTLICGDGKKIYGEYKHDEKALIMLDPPYLSMNNEFYDTLQGGNIYEHLYNYKIDDEKAQIILILNDCWVTQLLFKNSIREEYGKLYQTTKKKGQKHLIITNDKCLKNI